MRIRPYLHMLALLFVLTASSALAKHGAPARIEPIIHQGVRYVVPNDHGLRAYVEASDAQTGRKLWTKTVYRHRYVAIPFGRTECMSYEYVTSMVLQTNLLILTSDRGRGYTLDTRTRSIRQIQTKRPNIKRNVDNSNTRKNVANLERSGGLSPFPGLNPPFMDKSKVISFAATQNPANALKFPD